MNLNLVVNRPRPECILPIDHPARAHVAPLNTDVAATWEAHTPINEPLRYVPDDYEDCDRSGYLEMPGDFKP